MYLAPSLLVIDKWLPMARVLKDAGIVSNIITDTFAAELLDVETLNSEEVGVPELAIFSLITHPVLSPAVPAVPVEPDEPDEPEEPDEPTLPVEPDEPEEPDEPDELEAPVEPEVPVEPDEPDEPDAAGEVSMPDGTTWAGDAEETEEAEG